MRWSFCSACLTVALALACVSSTVREFYPAPENPRYSPQRGAAAVREYLRLRCPEMTQPLVRDSATLNGSLRVDSAGLVTAAELSETTGDEVMDGVIGTVLAQLDLSALPGRDAQRARYTTRVVYACRDSVTARIDVAP
jgi:hypothetical protein